MSKINILLLDNLNNIEKEKTIKKPKNYSELLKQLSLEIKINSAYLYLFIIDKNNKEKEINNEDSFNLLDDILFIREKEKNSIKQSIFERNYDKLSESRQEKIDEKYNCILCSLIIKRESPYFCYKCQKIFHEKCLKDWDKKCKSQNSKFSCPNCRNETPIEKWKKLLNYEDNRKDNANLLNEINEYKIDKNMNNNINIIKDKKIDELKDVTIKQEELIQIYENYIKKTNEVFRKIFNEVNSINTLLKLESNDPIKFEDLDIDDIWDTISEELENFKIYIINNNTNNIQRILNNFDNIKENQNNLNIYKINLMYYAPSNNQFRIFGNAQFFDGKLEKLIINGDESKPIFSKNSNQIYVDLKKGENIVTLILNNNKISYFRGAFDGCDTLIDISDLKYLDVSECNKFYEAFRGCKLLSDIKCLENWNVSNGLNFQSMFQYCLLLSDIKPLQNWNVSKGSYYAYMFMGCPLLSDIKPLENWYKKWNLLEWKDFLGMFYGCLQLKNILPIDNWKSLDSECHGMFGKCSIDKETLTKWKIEVIDELNYFYVACPY